MVEKLNLLKLENYLETDPEVRANIGDWQPQTTSWQLHIHVLLVTIDLCLVLMCQSDALM